VGLEPDTDEGLIKAAEAAASWAHARRAKWTTEPLRVPDRVDAFEEVEFEFEAQPTPAPPPPVTQPPPPPPAATKPPVAVPPSPPSKPPVIEWPTAEPEPILAPLAIPPPPPETRVSAPAAPARRARPARSIAEPLKIWAPRIAAVAALGAVVVAGVRYVPSLIPASTPKPKPAEPTKSKPAAAPAAAAKKTGTVNVSSTPTAQVIVDGKARGVTPLTLNDISPGRHEIVLRSQDGTVRRTVTVAANGTVSVEEAIFAGWVSVLSPFEVEVAENGRVLRPDDRSQIMLPPGTHDLRFANKTLGYATTQKVDVNPGEGTTIRLTPEPCRVTITTNEPAEVLVDGNKVGDVPLLGVGVPLGTHEIVVRRLAGGERRYTVTLGTAPYTLHVDF